MPFFSRAHAKFLKKKGFMWRCFADGRSGPITAAWNVHTSPSYFVLDRKGTIRYKAVETACNATTATSSMRCT